MPLLLVLAAGSRRSDEIEERLESRRSRSCVFWLDQSRVNLDWQRRPHRRSSSLFLEAHDVTSNYASDSLQEYGRNE